MLVLQRVLYMIELRVFLAFNNSDWKHSVHWIHRYGIITLLQCDGLLWSLIMNIRILVHLSSIWQNNVIIWNNHVENSNWTQVVWFVLLVVKWWHGLHILSVPQVCFVEQIIMWPWTQNTGEQASIVLIIIRLCLNLINIARNLRYWRIIVKWIQSEIRLNLIHKYKSRYIR